MNAEMEMPARRRRRVGTDKRRARPRAGHDSGVIALSIMGTYRGMQIDPEAIIRELGVGGRPISVAELERAASISGLSLMKQAGEPGELIGSLRKPALMARKDGTYVVILKGTRRGVCLMFEPTPDWRERRPARVPARVLVEQCAGEVYFVENAEERSAAPVKFGLSWFWPSVLRYRWPILHMLMASFFIQVFALSTPLFFQLIIDKVLVHKSMSTLIVVTIGLAAMGVFDVMLQYLRTYALGHTACRLDVELGGRLFGHLMKLPLGYFESRPAGQTVARVRELETIRSFLTGQGLTACVDLLFTLVFIAVLAFYSMKMTLIVLGSIPLYVIAAMIFRPVLRTKIRDKFSRGAESQQFLVESIIGIQTVKAAAVEPLMEWQWALRLAAYVRTSFQALMVATAGQNVIQYLTKLSTAVLLFFGAEQVIEGNITLGALVAFNMLSQQILAPVLRLSQLWQDFQQVQVSVARLGDIFESPMEAQAEPNTNLPAMRGAICLRDVHFRYNTDGPEVLKGINLDIAAGEVIGIVGPSGSGKSTLTKLIQRLYVPQSGQICIDDIDVARVRLPWLRGQMGVVLQENLLFNRTVRENIILANPLLPMERVVAISQLAGADEFISRMPQGYESQIVERGANLSGGQRQRVAIARALARDPRVLILDEATSALDYESERIIQRNMKDIVRGRTVIIIAHRLAAVRHCHRIVALSEGQVVEEGTHDELLQRSGGLYAHLWSLQSAGEEVT